MKKDIEILDAERNSLHGKVEVNVQQSISSYESIRSAIGYIYKMSRISMPQHMQDHLRIFIAGKRRAGIKEKEELGLTINEGKKPLSQDAYELISKTFFFSEKKEHVFAHVFLVLDWTLMKRAENCVNCKVNHISFRHDSLVFEFAKSKSHQKGEKHVGPWHVYANPLKPWCCPILSLARYFFSYPEVLRGDMPLFEGNSQYQRYHKLFSSLVQVLGPELQQMGYLPGDLGSHSCRKGVATLIASGCTVSPPIAPLCIRAGWVMGGMKDKYIFNEKAGDQYVGRCASLLDQLTKEFAVSPPYFDYSNLGAYEKNIKMKDVNEYLRSNLPYANSIHPQTWNIVLYCFATVCYHYTFLSDSLHTKCVLRCSPIFQNIPEDMIKSVRIAYPWDSTSDTPTFSGIPPHVITMAEFEKVRLELNSLKSSLPDSLSKMLDNRGFSSTGLNTDKVIEFFTKKSDEIVTEILNRANISVGREETGNAMDEDFILNEETLETKYENLVNLTETEKEMKTREHREKSTELVKKRKLKVGFHHGKLTILPPDFVWPKMTTQQLVINWMVGNFKENIPPYCALTVTDVVHAKRLYKPFHEMKILMRYIECVARRQNCWIINLKDRNHRNVIRMWEKIGNKFIIDPFAKKIGRRKETSWKTVYNRLALAKEFSKSSSIYKKNPKEIIPITGRPCSPPGRKDPPQTIAEASDVETNIDLNVQITYKNTNTEATNRTSRNNAEVVRLQRNPSGIFQIIKCDVCSCNT